MANINAGRNSSSAPAQPKVLRLLGLSEDVMWDLVCMLPVSDALVLSYTCRSLHDICTQRILTDVTVHVGDELVGFTSYVLAEPEKRLHWVRTLQVLIYNLGPPSTSGLDALVDVLRAVRKYHLISFTMKAASSLDGMETWFDSFCVALSELPSLDNLILNLNLVNFQMPGDTHLWSGLQRTFTTGLRSLELSALLHPIGGPEHTLALFRQIHSLQQLENLSLSNLHMLSTPDSYQPFSWPTVSTLKIASGIVSLSALSRMFPAVRTVKTLSVKADDAATSVDVASWQRLDCLSLWTSDSTLTAVRCPVRTLELKCRPSGSGSSLMDLVPHIYVLRPFALRLDSYMLHEVDAWHALADAMAAVGTRHLELEFKDHTNPSRCFWDWVNNVSQSVARTSLVAIKVVSTWPKALVQEIQADAVRILTNAVPTLQYTAVGSKGVPLTSYAIERVNGAANMKAIPMEEGECLVHNIMRQLELSRQGSPLKPSASDA